MLHFTTNFYLVSYVYLDHAAQQTVHSASVSVGGLSWGLFFRLFGQHMEPYDFCPILFYLAGLGLKSVRRRSRLM